MQSSPVLIGENALVLFLVLKSAIAVHFLRLIISVADGLLEALRLRQSIIHHILVVANQLHLPFEAVVPVVLRAGEQIHFLLTRSRVTLSPLGWVIQLRIVPKVVVESTLVASGLVHLLETSCRVGDVSVSTSAIVRVVDWLGVDMSSAISWSLLGNNERA